MERVATPKHLWIVGIVSLLWNAMGAVDYVMTETHNEAYMGQYTAEQLEYFYSFPTWFIAFWAIAVWSSVLGSVLLLLRIRWAGAAFFVSLLAMIPTSALQLRPERGRLAHGSGRRGVHGRDLRRGDLPAAVLARDVPAGRVALRNRSTDIPAGAGRGKA